jgi:hypothetical protein
MHSAGYVSDVPFIIGLRDLTSRDLANNRLPELSPE